MMIFENVFIIWATEALMLLYVLSVCRDIKLDKKDNLFAKLNKNMDLTVVLILRIFQTNLKGIFLKFSQTLLATYLKRHLMLKQIL